MGGFHSNCRTHKAKSLADRESPDANCAALRFGVGAGREGGKDRGRLSEGKSRFVVRLFLRRLAIIKLAKLLF